jgi:hypothetical protein
MKRISSLFAGTQSELSQTAKRYPSRALVLNLTTGEIRKGPGTGWAALEPLGDEDFVDVTVDAATTANVTIATALVTGQVIDGVTLAAGDLVLVKNQSTTHQNGIYVAGTTPARATGYTTYAAHAGLLVKVDAGTANNDKYFLSTSTTTGTLGTTAIAFVPFEKGALQQGVSALPAIGTMLGTDKVVVQRADGSLGTVLGSVLKTYTAA